jgi:ABC-type phosphate/phosphonate transport system substrate-binding protein
MTRLLCAPVRKGYRGPYYSSSFVVSSNAKFQTVEDLRGATFAYNGPDSLSGYHAVRLWLHAREETRNFFGDTVMSGGHVASLQLLQSGKVQVACIDQVPLPACLPETARFNLLCVILCLA